MRLLKKEKKRDTCWLAVGGFLPVSELVYSSSMPRNWVYITIGWFWSSLSWSWGEIISVIHFIMNLSPFWCMEQEIVWVPWGINIFISLKFIKVLKISSYLFSPSSQLAQKTPNLVWKCQGEGICVVVVMSGYYSGVLTYLIIHWALSLWSNLGLK